MQQKKPIDESWKTLRASLLADLRDLLAEVEKVGPTTTKTAAIGVVNHSGIITERILKAFIHDDLRPTEAESLNKQTLTRLLDAAGQKQGLPNSLFMDLRHLTQMRNDGCHDNVPDPGRYGERRLHAISWTVCDLARWFVEHRGDDVDAFVSELGDVRSATSPLSVRPAGASGSPERAFREALEALVADPRSGAALERAVSLASSQGRWEDLTEAATAALGSLHGAERAALGLQISRWYEERLNQRDRASDVIKDCLVYAPRHIGLLERLVTLHRGELEPLRRLLAAYREAGQWTKMIDLLKRSSERERNWVRRADHEFELARIYDYDLGEVSEALVHYGRAFELNPGDRRSAERLEALQPERGASSQPRAAESQPPSPGGQSPPEGGLSRLTNLALVVRERGAPLRRELFKQDEITVGSDAGNDVVLKGKQVAGRHCKIVRERGAFSVVSLDPVGQTLLRGTRVNQRAQLTHGDRIQVGTVVIEVDLS